MKEMLQLRCATHECGHTVSCKTMSGQNEIYSSPNGRCYIKSCNVGSILGIILMQTSPILGQTAVSIGIFGFASGTLFSLVTLPVEFDASKRAIWLERKES